MLPAFDTVPTIVVYVLTHIVFPPRNASLLKLTCEKWTAGISQNVLNKIVVCVRPRPYLRFPSVSDYWYVWNREKDTCVWIADNIKPDEYVEMLSGICAWEYHWEKMAKYMYRCNLDV